MFTQKYESSQTWSALNWNCISKFLSSGGKTRKTNFSLWEIQYYIHIDMIKSEGCVGQERILLQVNWNSTELCQLSCVEFFWRVSGQKMCKFRCQLCIFSCLPCQHGLPHKPKHRLWATPKSAQRNVHTQKQLCFVFCVSSWHLIWITGKHLSHRVLILK